MTELSKEHLLKCLTEANNYKQTKSYIDQVMSQNQTVYKVISDVLTAIVKSNKVALIGKLQGVRFFKDVFETGNFQCIDSLDTEIQDHIVAVAQYNKGSKQMNRGANYFIEVEKRPAKKDDSIKQMGTSYVLLALECIKNFAVWYPYDEDKQQTRFVQYYAMMNKNGVVFPQKESYFKPSDRQRFTKNYQHWMTKEIQQNINKANDTKQEHKVPLKQVQHNTVEQKQPQKPQLAEKKNQKQEKAKENLDKNQLNINSAILHSDTKKLEISQSFKAKEDKFQQSCSDKNLLKTLEKEIAAVREQLKQSTIENTKLKSQKEQTMKCSVKQQKDVQNLNKFLQQLARNKESLEKQLKEAKDGYEKLQKKLQQTLDAKQAEIIQIQANYKNQVNILKKNDQKGQSTLKEINQKDQKIVKLKQNNLKLFNEAADLTTKLSEKQKKLNDQKQELDTKNLKISFLQKQVSESETRQKKLEDRITGLVQEKQEKLKVTAENNSFLPLASSMNTQNSTSQNNAENACFILEKNADKLTEVAKKQEPASTIRNKLMISMSEFLSQGRKQLLEANETGQSPSRSPDFSKVNEQNSYKKSESRKSKSIGKTENGQSKLRDQQMLMTGTVTWNKTGSLWGTNSFATGMQQLKKTGFDRIKKPEGAKIVSVMPFIEEYFEPISLQDSFTFRSMCLMSNSSQSSPILSNDLIEIRLIRTPKTLIVSVKNQTQYEQQLTLTSQHEEVQILSDNNIQIVEPGRFADFTLKAHVTDLNMRFPICELSVVSSIEATYAFPLPVTLYSFCSFSELDQTQRLNLSSFQGLKCYKTEKFGMNKLYRSISNCMDKIRFTNLGQRKQWYGKIGYKYIPDICLLMKIEEYKRGCSIKVEFDQDSAINEAFAKVLLQVMMFLLM